MTTDSFFKNFLEGENDKGGNDKEGNDRGYYGN